MTFEELQERAAHARWYRELRAEHPEARARAVLGYIRASESGDGMSFAEFCCPGHEWAFTGTAYGGDDERWHGEGRCYCVHCGADGDA